MDPVTTTAVGVPLIKTLAPYLVSAGGSLLSQIIGNFGNRRAQDRAFRQNISMWDKQNQYNSPLEQQKRIKEAGLNPALMYGQGSVGNAQQMPQYQAPQFNASFTPQMNPVSLLGDYMNLEKANSDVSYTNQMTRNEIQKWWLLGTERDIKLSEKVIKGLEQSMMEATFDSRKEGILAQNIYNVANSQVMKWRANMINQYNMRPEDAVWLRGAVLLLNSLGYDKSKIESLMKGF